MRQSIATTQAQLVAVANTFVNYFSFLADNPYEKSLLGRSSSGESLQHCRDALIVTLLVLRLWAT